MVCPWYPFRAPLCLSANCRDKRHLILILIFGAPLLTAGCADNGAAPVGHTSSADASLVRAAPRVAELQILNRITWGESPSSAMVFKTAGRAAFLRRQLHPKDDLDLPNPVRDQ